jgi:hypothetical protein
VLFHLVNGSAALVESEPSNAQGIASVTLIFGYVPGKVLVEAILETSNPSHLLFSCQSTKPLVYVILSTIFTVLLVLGVGVIYFLTQRHRRQQYELLIRSPIFQLLQETSQGQH